MSKDLKWKTVRKNLFNVQLVYTHLDEPDTQFANDPSQAKYATTIVMDEKTGAEIENMMAEVKEASGRGKTRKNYDANVQYGDDKPEPEAGEDDKYVLFRGMRFIKATSKIKPKQYDGQGKEMPEDSDLRARSGDTVNIAIDVGLQDLGNKMFFRIHDLQVVKKASGGSAAPTGYGAVEGAPVVEPSDPVVDLDGDEVLF